LFTGDPRTRELPISLEKDSNDVDYEFMGDIPLQLVFHKNTQETNGTNHQELQDLIHAIVRNLLNRIIWTNSMIDIHQTTWQDYIDLLESRQLAEHEVQYILQAMVPMLFKTDSEIGLLQEQLWKWMDQEKSWDRWLSLLSAASLLALNERSIVKPLLDDLIEKHITSQADLQHIHPIDILFPILIYSLKKGIGNPARVLEVLFTEQVGSSPIKNKP
jgi:hypothetical protein